MLTWKTVGQHCPSSSSAATCAQRAEECQRTGGTNRAQTISGTTWFSSAPSRSLTCPSKDSWKMLGDQALWTIPNTISLSGSHSKTWWAGSHWCPAFWMVMWLQQSLTSAERTRIDVSLRVVQTQKQRMAGVAATSMRSTLGCGSLDVASLAWAAWWLRRLWIGRILPAKRKTSIRRRLMSAKRVMVPEMKCELDLYEYVLVQTEYVLFTPSTYLVSTIFPQYVRGTYWYVLWLQKYCSCAVCCMPVGNYSMSLWHVCCGAPILNQCPYCCPTYMTLFWYILVCTSAYSFRTGTY